MTRASRLDSLTTFHLTDPRAFALPETAPSAPPVLVHQVRHPPRLACRRPLHPIREARRARSAVPSLCPERAEVVR